MRMLSLVSCYVLLFLSFFFFIFKILGVFIKQDLVKLICNILWQFSSQFLEMILISRLVNISYINK